MIKNMHYLWMILASFFFATMALCIKFAAHSFNTFELVFYRALISVFFMLCVVWLRGTSLRSRVPGMHLWRGVVGAISIALWFYAITHLPLVTAMTLNYMSAVWVAAILVGAAALSTPRKPLASQGALVITILLGFVGVVLTLRPTLDDNQLFAGLVGLAGSITAALAYLQVSALGKMGEPEDRTVFYFSVSSAVLGGACMLLADATPWADIRASDAAWIVPAGILASLGQWCMTRAYSKGATLIVASLQYTGLLFSMLYGLILFDDHIPAMGWIGVAVIVLSALLATGLRRTSTK